MRDIKELSLQELEGVLKGWGIEVFHGKQIFFWIYKKGVTDFAAMSDLSLDLRSRLKKNFCLLNLKLIRVFKSKDGTEKFLLELKDKELIEAVNIPMNKRTTGCISTQVGCKFRCFFCASGLLGFKRNLTTLEMVDELLYLKNNAQQGNLTNIVFMGIGEPLDNYDNVLETIRIINCAHAFNIGSRRITISTCGIIPAIKRLAEEDLQIELSISLHAADEKTRSHLVPVNKIYPLKELISTCRDYIKKTGRQITFEYVLIKGINSDLESAQKLSKILNTLKLCKVNLIPANPVRNTKDTDMKNKVSNGANPVSPVRNKTPKASASALVRISNGVKECNIQPPSKLEVLLFRDYLLKQRLNVTLRRARGLDIEAACGQLRARYEKEA